MIVHAISGVSVTVYAVSGIQINQLLYPWNTNPYVLCMYVPGLGSRSRSEPGVFGYLEPKPLEKK